MNPMKNPISILFVLFTLFSCSKSDNEITPEKLILGKWELSSAIPWNPYLREIKERSFSFDTANVGIRGIRLNGKWGGLLAHWDQNGTVKHEYSLSKNNKILSINYEDGEIVTFDVIELNEVSLIIKQHNYNSSNLPFIRKQ